MAQPHNQADPPPAALPTRDRRAKPRRTWFQSRSARKRAVPDLGPSTITVNKCPLCDHNHTYQLPEYKRRQVVIALYPEVALPLLGLQPYRDPPANKPSKEIAQLFPCPEKDQDYEVVYRATKGDDGTWGIAYISSAAAAPHERALFATAQAIMTSSTATASDFCKTMMTVSTGAIAVFLSLIKAVVAQNYVPSPSTADDIIANGILFLAASVIFALGYYPQLASFSADIPAQIDRARSRVLLIRTALSFLGFAVFVAAIIRSLGTIVSIARGTGIQPFRPV